VVHGYAKYSVCVYKVMKDGKRLGFGQSTSPFAYVVKCKQHSLLYILS
jgi:hypothetical protein